MQVGFSTVACHDWPLDRVVSYAEELGFAGIDFRTLGPDSARFACDPSMTSVAKIRSVLSEHGVEAQMVSTGISFDAPIRPPILGRAIQDHDRPVREVRRAIELAAGIGAPFVRVFAFTTHGRETRTAAAKRIAERLYLAGAAARHTGVQVLVENGGAFSTSEAMHDLLDRVRHPLVRVAYNVAAAHLAGEDPIEGALALGERLAVLKVKDVADGHPVMLGEGSVPVEPVVRRLSSSGFRGPVVFEWDRAWVPDLGEPQDVLPKAAERLYRWQAVRSGGAWSGGRVAASA